MFLILYMISNLFINTLINNYSNVIYRIVDDDYMNGKKFLVVKEKFYIEVVATKDFEISEV